MSRDGNPSLPPVEAPIVRKKFRLLTDDFAGLDQAVRALLSPERGNGVNNARLAGGRVLTIPISLDANASERPRWNKGDLFGMLCNGHGTR
jgi:hypothetical protein